MRIKGIIAILTSLAILSSTDVYGHTMRGIGTYSESDGSNPGWIFNIDPKFSHSKNKKNDYRYKTEAMKNKYDTHFKAGIKLWGSLIEMNEKRFTSNVVTEGETEYSKKATAVAEIRGISLLKTNQHIKGWTITVNTSPEAITPFRTLSSYDRSIIMAHEIGHVYGLGDLEHNKHRGKLMFGSNVGTVTASDRLGMQVVTGAHKKHEKKSSDKYDKIRSKEHTRVCSCGLKVNEKHKFDKFGTYPSSNAKRSTLHTVKCGCGQTGKDKAHSYGGLFGIGVKVQYTQATAAEHNEIKKCKGCSYNNSVRKKHSTGGKFSDGKKVRYTRANANEHNEIKKCKGCNYEHSVRKKHRFDKKGKCKDCGFVK
ncbi:MAG: hypothetical protein FWH04_09600 [Oscillospiraceae bacterium]|nr:hypothetical protein [Oscillospiraceae bacterium]